MPKTITRVSGDQHNAIEQFDSFVQQLRQKLLDRSLGWNIEHTKLTNEAGVQYASRFVVVTVVPGVPSDPSEPEDTDTVLEPPPAAEAATDVST